MNKITVQFESWDLIIYYFLGIRRSASNCFANAFNFVLNDLRKLFYILIDIFWQMSIRIHRTFVFPVSIYLTKLTMRINLILT